MCWKIVAQGWERTRRWWHGREAHRQKTSCATVKEEVSGRYNRGGIRIYTYLVHLWRVFKYDPSWRLVEVGDKSSTREAGQVESTTMLLSFG